MPAELLAVSVSRVLPVVGFALQEAVTPLGSPDMARFTLPLNPFCETTEIVDVSEPPGTKVKASGASARVKVTASTVKAMDAVAMMLPEVPVIVTVAGPGVAELLAVSVSKTVPVEGLGLKEAVTPLGRPDAVKLMLPLNPYCG